MIRSLVYRPFWGPNDRRLWTVVIEYADGTISLEIRSAAWGRR